MAGWLPAHVGAGATLDDRANALARAINNTGVQSLNNPCTVGAYYAGAGFLAAITTGAVYTEAAEAVTTRWPDALLWFNRMVTQKVGPGWVYFATRAAKALPAACDAMQQ